MAEAAVLLLEILRFYRCSSAPEAFPIFVLLKYIMMHTVKYSTLLPVLALFLSLQACVKGKGPVVSKTFEPGSFDRVDMATAGEITVIHDGTDLVKVTSNENIINALRINVSSGKLHIDAKPMKILQKYDVLNIEVHTSAKLRGLSTSASGNIRCTDCLDTQAELKTSASGGIEVTGIFDNLSAATSASGNITLKGAATNAVYKTSASGNIFGFDCITQNTEARTSASGNIETTVMQKLTGSISGSGNIRYKGDPSQINVDDSASGGVEKVN